MGLVDAVYNFIVNTDIFEEGSLMDYVIKTRCSGIQLEIRPYNHEKDYSGLAVFKFDGAVRGDYELIKDFSVYECKNGTCDTWLDTPCGSDGSSRRSKTFQFYYCDTTLGRFAYSLGADKDCGSLGVKDLIYADDILIFHVTDMSGYKHVYVCHKDKSLELTKYINKMYAHLACDFKIF